MGFDSVYLRSASKKYIGLAGKGKAKIKLFSSKKKASKWNIQMDNREKGRIQLATEPRNSQKMNMDVWNVPEDSMLDSSIVLYPASNHGNQKFRIRNFPGSAQLYIGFDRFTVAEQLGTDELVYLNQAGKKYASRYTWTVETV